MKYPGTYRMAYPVICSITGDCRKAQESKENANIEGTRGSERPSRKEERIAGEHRSYYQTGLAKDDEEKNQVGPYAVILDNDSKVLVQVHKDVEECLYHFHSRYFT